MLWLIFIALEIARNYILIEVLKLRPHYGHSALIRFGFAVIFLFKRHPEFDPLGDVTTIFPATTYALFQWTSFYLLFDLILNLLRGKPIDYQGKNSRFTDSLDKQMYYLLKVGAVVVLILTLLVMYG